MAFPAACECGAEEQTVDHKTMFLFVSCGLCENCYWKWSIAVVQNAQQEVLKTRSIDESLPMYSK